MIIFYRILGHKKNLPLLKKMLDTPLRDVG
jgi:hypothetical protein